MSGRVDFQGAYEHAIETISIGLLELDQLPLEKLGGSKLVDVSARLNAQYKALDKLTEPLKNKLKVEGLEGMQEVHGDSCTLRGDNYQAIIQKCAKTILNTTKVKEYLGKKLPSFLCRTEEVRINFSVKG